MTFPLMPLLPSTTEPGISWQAVGNLTTSDDLRQLSVSPGGVWVAAKESAVGVVARSTNYGATWSNVSTGSTDVNGSIGSAFGNGLFVNTDWGGDGIYWFSPTSGSNGSLIIGSRDNFRVHYNDGYFVIGSGTAGGSGAIYASANGTTWVYNQQGAVGANSATCGIYVAALNRTFAGGNQYRYVNAIPTSATAWTGSSTGLSGRITDVDWSPTAAVAVVTGPSGIYSSADLITWTLRQSATNMYGVAWCETQFVAVGSLGKIFTSPNGVTWTARTSGTTTDLHGAAGYNGVILVSGTDGLVLRSS